MNQLNLFSGIDNLKFVEYHQRLPQVYELFKITSFMAINRGYINWSAKAVFEIIRWELSLKPINDEAFKVNNNYTALYSRMFENEYPEHKDFFRKRESKFDKLK